ncbi:hypothetical protein D9M68_136590 [compost metagenome]
MFDGKLFQFAQRILRQRGHVEPAVEVALPECGLLHAQAVHQCFGGCHGDMLDGAILHVDTVLTAELLQFDRVLPCGLVVQLKRAGTATMDVFHRAGPVACGICAHRGSPNAAQSSLIFASLIRVLNLAFSCLMYAVKSAGWDVVALNPYSPNTLTAFSEANAFATSFRMR